MSRRAKTVEVGVKHVPIQGEVISRQAPQIESVDSDLRILFSPHETEILVLLRYPNETKIFDVNDKELMYTVWGISQKIGFDNMVEFLSQVKDKRDIIWNNPTLDKEKLKMKKEIDLFQYRQKGIKGIGVCRYCKSDKLRVEQKQTRSADEGMTTFYICTKCDSRL